MMSSVPRLETVARQLSRVLDGGGRAAQPRAARVDPVLPVSCGSCCFEPCVARYRWGVLKLVHLLLGLHFLWVYAVYVCCCCRTRARRDQGLRAAYTTACCAIARGLLSVVPGMSMYVSRKNLAELQAALTQRQARVFLAWSMFGQILRPDAEDDTVSAAFMEPSSEGRVPVPLLGQQHAVPLHVLLYVLCFIMTANPAAVVTCAFPAEMLARSPILKLFLDAMDVPVASNIVHDGDLVNRHPTSTYCSDVAQDSCRNANAVAPPHVFLCLVRDDEVQRRAMLQAQFDSSQQVQPQAGHDFASSVAFVPHDHVAAVTRTYVARLARQLYRATALFRGTTLVRYRMSGWMQSRFPQGTWPSLSSGTFPVHVIHTVEPLPLAESTDLGSSGPQVQNFVTASLNGNAELVATGRDGLETTSTVVVAAAAAAATSLIPYTSAASSSPQAGPMTTAASANLNARILVLLNREWRVSELLAILVVLGKAVMVCCVVVTVLATGLVRPSMLLGLALCGYSVLALYATACAPHYTARPIT